ncbi:MAG: hypothetical protein ACKOAS_08505 [Verrucomicrobiota bacterium]
MPYLDAAIVVFLIALSLSFLLRGAWKKAHTTKSHGCSTGACGCSAQKTAASRE